MEHTPTSGMIGGFRAKAYNIAPVVYRPAWRKEISVAQDCTDRKWMNGLKRITTTEQIFTRHLHGEEDFTTAQDTRRS
jgi:hypothetical protein